MNMGDEKVNLYLFSILGQFFTEGPDPRSRIHNDCLSALKRDFKSGRVSPIYGSIRPRDRHRASRTPKLYSHIAITPAALIQSLLLRWGAEMKTPIKIA